jgi:hypothetical protein
LTSTLKFDSPNNDCRASDTPAQTVAACQNLYKNSFTYHTLKEGDMLDFDECFEFIGKPSTSGSASALHSLCKDPESDHTSDGCIGCFILTALVTCSSPLFSGWSGTLSWSP